MSPNRGDRHGEIIIPRSVDPILGMEIVQDMIAVCERSMHKPDEPIQKVLMCDDQELGEIVERFLSRDACYRSLGEMGRFSDKHGWKFIVNVRNIEAITHRIINGLRVSLCATRDITPRQLIEFRLLFRIACTSVLSAMKAATEPNPSFF